MADLFRLGQEAGGKAKVHNPTGAAAKAITSRCECFAHSARSQLWGSLSDHTSLKNVDFNWQVKMLNNSCDPREQIWNPVTLHEIIECDLHVQIPSWQRRVFLQKNFPIRLQSPPLFLKSSSALQWSFLLESFLPCKLKFKASLIWCCAMISKVGNLPAQGGQIVGLLSHLANFPVKKQKILGDNEKSQPVLGRAGTAHRHSAWALLRHCRKPTLVISLQNRDLVLNSPRTRLPKQSKS